MCTVTSLPPKKAMAHGLEFLERIRKCHIIEFFVTDTFANLFGKNLGRAGNKFGLIDGANINWKLKPTNEDNTATNLVEDVEEQRKNEAEGDVEPSTKHRRTQKSDATGSQDVGTPISTPSEEHVQNGQNVPAEFHQQQVVPTHHLQNGKAAIISAEDHIEKVRVE
jgi:hypothetical protein